MTRPAPPLPLGFLALAAGTTLLAALNLGWLDPADGRAVAVALLAFVAPLQGVASLMGFALGEVVPATAMGVLAGTWATTGVMLISSPPGGTSAGLGLQLLLSCGALALAGAMAAARGAVLAALVVSGASLRFGLTGLHQLTGAGGWEGAAGVAGLALAAVAAVAAAVLGRAEARRERPP